MTPRTKLYNPYYYVNNGVIFKIDYNLDNADDSCAKHYVTYETKAKSLKKGDTYIDNHGDKQVLDADNANTPVSTGVVNVNASKNNFPYISFSYKVDGNTEDTFEETVWFGHEIKVGDKLSSNKFVKTIHGEVESNEDFALTYKKEVVAGVAKAIVKGKTIDEAKKSYPGYVFAGTSFKYNGKNVTRTGSISSSAPANTFPIKDPEINNAVIDEINAKTEEYANSMLENIGKVIKSDVDLIITNNIQDA